MTGQSELNVKLSNIQARFNVYNALAKRWRYVVILIFQKTGIRHALEHLYVNGRMEIVHSPNDVP